MARCRDLDENLDANGALVHSFLYGSLITAPGVRDQVQHEPIMSFASKTPRHCFAMARCDGGNPKYAEKDHKSSDEDGRHSIAVERSEK